MVVVDMEDHDARVTEWSSLVNPGVPIPAGNPVADRHHERDGARRAGCSPSWRRTCTTGSKARSSLRTTPASTMASCAPSSRAPDSTSMPRRYARCDCRGICIPTARRTRSTPSSSASGSGGEQRHRALGDARVLWRLLQKLADRHPPAELELAVAALLRHPSLPSHLPPDALDAVPHAPGVYLFYGLNEHPIYIGKSVDLRARVTGPLQRRVPRAARIAAVAGSPSPRMGGNGGRARRAAARRRTRQDAPAGAQHRAAPQGEPGDAGTRRRQPAALPPCHRRCPWTPSAASTGRSAHAHPHGEC